MSNHPPCAAWAEKLALRREDLSLSDREALDAHLAHCTVCQQALEDYHFLDAMLRALPPPSVKPLPRLSLLLETREATDIPVTSHRGFDATRLPRRGSQPQAGRGMARKRSGRLFPILAVACILLLFLLGGMFMYRATTSVARSTGTALYTYRGQVDFVSAVAWSPGGLLVATGNWDKTVRVWNAKTGEVIQTYTGHTELVDALGWSPNGRYIASGSWDKTLQVWDAFSGQPLWPHPAYQGAEVSSLAWSPDGQYIAVGSWDHTVKVWNVSTEQLVMTYGRQGEFVNTVAWSPNGQYLASAGGNDKVLIWDPLTGITFQVCHYPEGNPVDALAWSPDNKEIAIAGRANTVQICNVSSGKNVLTYMGHSNEVDAVSWSPNGKYIVSGSWDHTARVWDAKTGATVLIYKGHSDIVDAVAWSPDGKYIISGSWDRTAQVWKPGV
jgi:WD40 repeat protein